MSDVEFDEENTLLNEMPKQAENVSSMSRFVMKIGLAKNKQQVNIVLVIFVICLFTFTIYTIRKFVIY